MTTTRLGWREEAREEQQAALARTRKPAWPDAVAYREVIQNPGACLTHEALRDSTVALDRRGLPLAYTGRFAVVFRLTPRDGTTWAVRCFTTPPKGDGDSRAARYATLEPRLAASEVADLFVPFAYLPNGIKMAGQEYPVLAMQWADGEPLGRFVENHRDDPEALLTLAATLGDALERLRGAGIAHGDWQHDNLIVSDGGRRVAFVDYDGVYVEDLDLFPPGEKGHPNYQPPARSEADYGPDLDRFSCLLMQTGLVALAAEPSLWDSYADGESLLLRAEDLADPAASGTFATLRLVAEGEPELAALLKRVEDACGGGAPPPDAAPRAVLERVAARAGVALRKPEKSGKGARRGSGGAGSAVAVRAKPAQEKKAVAASAEAQRWLNFLRGGLKKQADAEHLHLWLMRLFYLGVFLSNVYPLAFLPEMWGVFCLFLIVPVATAVGYYLWPRNLDGIKLSEAQDKNRENVERNGGELGNYRKRLYEINRDPANLSQVAFVAAALQAVRLDASEVRTALRLERKELLALGRAGVTRLSDLPADLSFALPEGQAVRLLDFKKRVMDQAREAYQGVATVRRDLQHEIDRLETERQGLLDIEVELRQRAKRLGDPSFGRFLARLFGF